MSRILITGATGYVGGKLSMYLASRGHLVHSLCRQYSVDFEQHQNIRYEVLSAGRSLESIFSNNEFNEVIHLATHYSHYVDESSVERLIESNISFGLALLQAMQRHNCKRLINVTTCAEFGASGEYQPNSLYAASKRAFRDFIQYYVSCGAFSAVDLVLYDNYGPSDPRPKIIQLLCKHLDSVNQIKLSPGEQQLNLVHINDTVRAIALAVDIMRSNPDEVSKDLYCVAPPRAISLRELARTLEVISGKKINALWGGRPYRENEIMIPWRGEIVPGWSADVSLSDGLRELI